MRKHWRSTELPSCHVTVCDALGRMGRPGVEHRLARSIHGERPLVIMEMKHCDNLGHFSKRGLAPEIPPGWRFQKCLCTDVTCEESKHRGVWNGVMANRRHDQGAGADEPPSGTDVVMRA